jgi:hypothetical protein
MVPARVLVPELEPVLERALAPVLVLVRHTR